MPLPEGITLDARTRVHVKIVFRPTSVGSDSGEYRLNSNAGGGYVVVRFSGRGE